MDQWTFCRDDMPKEKGEYYIVAFFDHNGWGSDVYYAYYFPKDGNENCWWEDDDMDCNFIGEIIAWIPWPKFPDLPKGFADNVVISAANALIDGDVSVCDSELELASSDLDKNEKEANNNE